MLLIISTINLFYIFIVNLQTFSLHLQHPTKNNLFVQSKFITVVPVVFIFCHSAINIVIAYQLDASAACQDEASVLLGQKTLYDVATWNITFLTYYFSDVCSNSSESPALLCSTQKLKHNASVPLSRPAEVTAQKFMNNAFCCLVLLSLVCHCDILYITSLDTLF